MKTQRWKLRASKTESGTLISFYKNVSLENILLLSHFAAALPFPVASPGLTAQKPFCPPRPPWAYNHHAALSCWTKWTEEYLKAYHWHCATQNSSCLCYAHLSLSPSLLIHIWHGWMVILPGENWKRLCAALQYVLPASLWVFLWSRGS